MDTKNEEETIVASSEQSNASKEEEEQVIIEKPESDSEKEKHEIPSKSETVITDNNFDAQPLLEQSVIVEGKRSRKPTLRLEISELVPAKKDLIIPQGHGKPLGEIEYINYQITHASTDALSRMRTICFGRRGNKATIRKNLREFKGFEFDRDSNEYQKHLSNLIKLKKDQLRSISIILGLPSTGRNTDHAERILNFLMEPIDEGRKIPGKKSATRNLKKRSTNSKESVDTDPETKKQKTENGKDEHGLDYNFTPGKRSSDQQQNSTNIKRKKGISKSNENNETVEDITDSKLIEKTEALTTDTVE